MLQREDLPALIVLGVMYAILCGLVALAFL